MGITAVKWKPNFLNEVKLCGICSNPLHGINHLQVLIYLQSIVQCFVSKIKNKWKKENLKILDLQSWKAMCTSKRTQRPLQDVMGSLSPLISTKMLVVVYSLIAFGQKL